MSQPGPRTPANKKNQHSTFMQREEMTHARIYQQ